MKQEGGADYIMAFKARIFYFSRKYVYLLFLLIIYLYGYIEFQLKVILDEKVCAVKHGTSISLLVTGLQTIAIPEALFS